MIYVVIGLALLLVIIAIASNRRNQGPPQGQLTEILPDFEAYGTKHSACKTENGMKCYKCGSGQLLNKGVAGEADRQRIVSCVHCGTALYTLKI